MSDSSDHDYALVVMLNESESTGDRLTFTVQKVNQADLDPEQTRVAIIDNEGVQTKVALPASLVNPLNQLSAEGEDVANAYLQTVVLQSLESVAKTNREGIDALETPSNDINIVLKEEGDLSGSNMEEGDTSKENGNDNNAIFEDLSTIQNMLMTLKEKGTIGGTQDDHNSDRTVITTVNETEISENTVAVNMMTSAHAHVSIVNDEMIVEEGVPKYSKVYKCGFCNATYTTKYSLNIHIRMHTGEKPFKCTECDAQFIRRSYLKYHMQNHTGVKLYQCSRCDMSYTSGSSLKNHIRTHTGEKPYKCGECDESFARKAYLNHHEVIAHQCALPYSCHQCDKVYKTKSSLRMHVKTHTVCEGDHPNKCHICEKTFTRQHDLKRHVASVHEKKQLFHCKLCDMSYTAKGSLVVHMRSHTGEKPFACDRCDAKFARNTYLKIHKLSHENKKPIKCEICNTGFTVASSLNQHMKRHNGEKPYSCDICDAKFYRQRSAVEHKRVHTGEKPYKCQLCDKQFAWRCDMRRHAKVHSGDKLRCPRCRTTFASLSKLTIHYQSDSCGNSFCCPKCDNIFQEESELEVHLSEDCVEADHGSSDEVEYKCEVCETRYSNLSSLKSHMTSIHGDGLEKPESTSSTVKEEEEEDEMESEKESIEGEIAEHGGVVEGGRLEEDITEETGGVVVDIAEETGVVVEYVAEEADIETGHVVEADVVAIIEHVENVEAKEICQEKDKLAAISRVMS